MCGGLSETADHAYPLQIQDGGGMPIHRQGTGDHEGLSGGMYRVWDLCKKLSFGSDSGAGFSRGYRSGEVYRLRRMCGEVSEEGDCHAVNLTTGDMEDEITG